MLTSYHYLLSGFTAAFVATSILHSTDMNLQRSLSGFFQLSTSEAVDVAYRGSGRLEGNPNESTKNDKNASIAIHRGSGRVDLNVL